MSKKSNIGEIVYSTNPDFYYADDLNQSVETFLPEKQKLKVFIDKKQRKGKTVTLITGFIGTNDALKELEKKLKTHCGSGGSSKDGEILIQGDFKEKISEFLTKNRYGVRK